MSDERVDERGGEGQEAWVASEDDFHRVEVRLDEDGDVHFQLFIRELAADDDPAAEVWVEARALFAWLQRVLAAPEVRP